MGALTAFLIGLTKYLTRSDLQVRYFSFQLKEVQPHHGGKATAAGSSIMEQGTADCTWGQTIYKTSSVSSDLLLCKRPHLFRFVFEKGLRPRLLRIPQSPQTAWNKVFKHTKLWQTLRIQNAVGDTPLPLNGSAS